MRKVLTFISFIILLLSTSVFIVQEGQRGIILRFGKVLRDQYNNPLVYSPGLHIKIPYIESVKNLDSRIQTMENQADRFVSMEKKDLIVDSYIKWKISNFSKYYLTTGGGDISQAEVLLKRKFSDRLRSEFGKLIVKEIVTDSRNKLMNDVKEALNHGTAGEDEVNNYIKENNSISTNISKKTKTNIEEVSINLNSMETLGIEVVDVKIKQINLPSEVSDAIYQRMRAEREAVARRHRSQGQEVAEKLRAAADYEVSKILSESKKQALILKGEADAETARLYANAFNQEPELYEFLRSLRLYEHSFKEKNDIVILSPDNNFFKLMNFNKK